MQPGDFELYIDDCLAPVDATLGSLVASNCPTAGFDVIFSEFHGISRKYDPNVTYQICEIILCNFLHVCFLHLWQPQLEGLVSVQLIGWRIDRDSLSPRRLPGREGLVALRETDIKTCQGQIDHENLEIIQVMI